MTVSLATLVASLVFVACGASKEACAGSSCPSLSDLEVSGNLNLLQTGITVRGQKLESEEGDSKQRQPGPNGEAFENVGQGACMTAGGRHLAQLVKQVPESVCISTCAGASDCVAYLYDGAWCYLKADVGNALYAQVPGGGWLVEDASTRSPEHPFCTASERCQIGGTDGTSGYVCMAKPAPTEAPTAAPTEAPTAAPTPASCPDGSTQVGEHNADIRGCGFQRCDSPGRYGLASAEDCLQQCRNRRRCTVFSWAPMGGDRQHMDQTVCTLYEYNTDAPVSSTGWNSWNTDGWGPNQVVCRKQ